MAGLMRLIVTDPMMPRNGSWHQPKERTHPMTNAQENAARKPTHRLYHVEGAGETANWTVIGAAWQNKDGNGFNISCAAIPLTGRIVMRKIKPKSQAEPAMI
jgi:hypothetical protein